MEPRFESRQLTDIQASWRKEPTIVAHGRGTKQRDEKHQIQKQKVLGAIPWDICLRKNLRVDSG